MIRKRIVYLDFKNNSLKRVFFIKSPGGSGFHDREEMEWFMRQIQMSLRNPSECFGVDTEIR